METATELETVNYSGYNFYLFPQDLKFDILQKYRRNAEFQGIKLANWGGFEKFICGIRLYKSQDGNHIIVEGESVTTSKSMLEELAKKFRAKKD